MNGYAYGEKEPTENCPYCGNECFADFADVGIGMVQCGPFHCQSCKASEIGPYDDHRPLTEHEKEAGWYKPESEPGSSANNIGGQIVDHQTMKAYYSALNSISDTLDEDRSV